MKQAIVIIGIGELAGVFARGFLRCGYPVYPITREMDLTEESKKIPTPKLVLIMVQESELNVLLKQIPEIWRDKIGLVQNELLPRDWQRHNIKTPTVTTVWFEKKKETEVVNILKSPSFGPSAELVSKALQAVGIPAPVLENKQEMLYELTRKTVYILTVNIAGLVNNCTVGDLWIHHQPLARKIAEEIILILEYLTDEPLPQEKLIKGMVDGIKDCPDRFCLGRSAPARLKRALQYAKNANLKTPKLEEIAKNIR